MDSLPLNRSEKIEFIKHQILLDNSKGFAARLSEKYGITRERVWHYAKQLGLGVFTKIDVHKDELIRDYSLGLSLSELGAKYKHYEANIRRLLVREGVVIRRNGESQTKHTWDREYFKMINSHEKAYWLGFIYADGNVRTKEYGQGLFQLALSKKDWGHVEKLKECLKSSHPVSPDRDNARFVISQNEIYTDLVNLGVCPRKSLEIIFPSQDQVPEQFINSFILGYFDGDGTVGYNNLLQWQFQIIGTEPFLLTLQTYLIRATNFNQTQLSLEKRSGEGKIFTLSYGGGIKNGDISRPLALYNYLYKDSSVFLKRKKDKFEYLINYHNGTIKI